MNNVAIEQLMHDVLDGVATPEEETRLEQRLAADPVLRERYTELRSMFDTLNRMPLVDPPDDLHAELMRTIERGQAGRTRNPGWLAVLADSFRARPVPAFGLAGLTIVALALVLWSGAGRRDMRIAGGDSPVTGTMAPPAAADVVSLEAGDARIRIELERENGVLIAALSGVAPSGATLEISGASIDRHASIEGEGAAIDETASLAGRVRTNLEGTVRARLHIGSGAAGNVEATLMTSAGTSRHVFTPGRRTRP